MVARGKLQQTSASRATRIEGMALAGNIAQCENEKNRQQRPDQSANVHARFRFLGTKSTLAERLHDSAATTMQCSRAAGLSIWHSAGHIGRRDCCLPMASTSRS